MALLHIAPTKSSMLALGRQLAFAEEGYDLLEQKRQILVNELMSRLKHAQELERALRHRFAGAHGLLRDATLAAGSAVLDRAALGVQPGVAVSLAVSHVMGLRLPGAETDHQGGAAGFGVAGTPAAADAAAARFAALLPLLAELAGLQTSIHRIAVELRRTQRRCNALLKIFIPDYRETIAYIRAALEERERESFVILKMIRARLRPL